jgi:hypothetical protein
MYDVSMVSFGLSFIKKRLGGCSLTEKLASRMTRGSSATAAARSFVNIMKRVFGGRGSEVVARSVREELGRLIHKRPMCKYMSSLQVMPLCTDIYAGCVTLFWFFRRKRGGALLATSHLHVTCRLLQRSSESELIHLTLPTPASAPRLKIDTLMSLNYAA